jgi:hypothetical protein
MRRGFIIRRRFERTCRFYLQGKINNESKEKARRSVSKASVSYQLTIFLGRVISSILKMEATRSPKRRFIVNSHGATSQKMAFFIVTSVKTSIPT